MKRLIPIVLCVLLLVGCGSTDVDTSDDSSATETEVGSIAEYDNTSAELLDAEFYESDDGTALIRVYVNYTNSGSDGMYMMESFSVKAFQNDTEISDCTDINDDESSANLITEVKDGESIKSSYVFELSDDSDVEVRICSPTADEELLASKTYIK